ncbi:MAG: hypothetical protein Q9190_007739 [Brigantiaea leucoxantha]
MDQQTAAEQFLELVSDPFRSQIQGAAVASALVTSITLTIGIILLFSYLRPRNTLVYAPRTHYAHSSSEPKIDKSLGTWMELIQKCDDDLVTGIGMDATIFIKFMRMLRDIFLILTVLGCAVLIPVYVRETMSGSKINVFSRMMPLNIALKSFWATVSVAWLMNIVVCGFLYVNYQGATKLRQNYFKSKEYRESVHSRTLLITDVPDGGADEKLLEIVKKVKNDITNTTPRIGRDVEELLGLIKEYEKTVEQFEALLIKPPESLHHSTCDENLSKLRDIKTRVEECRAATTEKSKTLPYGFVICSSVEDAHAVAAIANDIDAPNVSGATVQLAPRLPDIIWQNLSLPRETKKRRSCMNNLWIILLSLAWMVMNALTAVFLLNLNNLGLLWSSFNSELRKHPMLWAIVQGVVAPATTSCLYTILPKVFRRLFTKAGDMTKSARDQDVIHKLFGFFVVNNLLVFSMMGTAWQFGAAMIAAKKQDQKILDAINSGETMKELMIALCNVTPYWSSYLLMRSLSAAVDLAQITNLAFGYLKRKYLSKVSPTPRELIKASEPPPFDYVNYYSYLLFFTTVALCFAVVQPIVLPIAAVYFALDVWLKTYQLVYVFRTRSESEGMFWKALFNRILFAVFLADIFVVLVCAAQSGGQDRSWAWMIAVVMPLPFLLYAFWRLCSRKFDKRFKFYCSFASKVEENVDKGARLETFGHPVLERELMRLLVYENVTRLLGGQTKAKWSKLNIDSLSHNAMEVEM